MNELLINYIKSELHNGTLDENIEPTDDLLGSGLVDSMGMMRLIAFIEEEKSIKVLPEDMTIENFMTVEAISNYIAERKKQC